VDGVILTADFKETMGGDEVVALILKVSSEGNRGKIVEDVGLTDFEKDGAVGLKLVDVGE